MPWKVSGVMEERERFVRACMAGEMSMSELCRVFGIARKTGYKWRERYDADGRQGMADQSRAPENHPNQTPEWIEQCVLELRRAHPSWGPRKLKGRLEKRRPRTTWPAPSTIGAMIQRAGLVIERRYRRRTPPYTAPFATADAPNAIWCADFKGWFRTRDGARIDPLTMTDAHSRYLLRCQVVSKTDTEAVRGICEAAFREYGMPLAIRTDNGAPFAARAIAGLSRLSAWWMKLGIVPERIEPGHPEQNGRHERMHRTLKQETAHPPAASRRAQQRAFDAFRREYNQERPHQALAMHTPAEIYAPSPRAFPARVPEPEYDSSCQVRRVQQHGEFNWKHQHVFLSETLAGERVGLEPLDERFWWVYFAAFPIAVFDAATSHVLPLPDDGNRRWKSGNPNPRDSQTPTAATTAATIADEQP